MVVAYHVIQLGATEKSMTDEIVENYKGKIVVGRDLDIF